MNDQQPSLDQVIENAVEEILAATHARAAKALSRAFGGTTAGVAASRKPKAVTRPVGGGSSRRKARSPEVIARLTDSLLEQIQTQPGQRIGELAATLSSTRQELAVPLARLRRQAAVKTIGNSMHAQYFPQWPQGTLPDREVSGGDEAR